MYKQFIEATGAEMSSDFIFRQLFDRESCTYTYLLADGGTKEAIVIDPVIEMVDRDIEQLEGLGLKLLYAINTHVHADHVTGSGMLKKKTGCKTAIAKVSTAEGDLKIGAGDEFTFGKYTLEVRATPGHTNGCLTYVLRDLGMVFTGDALLIRGCGRTDFQEGSAATLYKSVWDNILSLPDDTKLYPAHDYKGRTVTTVGEEKRFNPRLTKEVDEFVKIMDNLGLPYPKKIDVSLPANMVCGLYEVP
ncbi:unnamed protein product, partial [Owenia fusiformis]